MSRQISLEENGEAIEFVGKINDDMTTSLLALYVNGVLQDTYRASPSEGVFGCLICLHGKLKDGKRVKLQLRTHFFMRPEYTFFINNVVVRVKKGTWGGM